MEIGAKPSSAQAIMETNIVLMGIKKKSINGNEIMREYAMLATLHWLLYWLDVL